MEVKSRPTRLDLLRANYDNLCELREYFGKCDKEVVRHLIAAIEQIRFATVAYQKFHCDQDMGWGVLHDAEAIQDEYRDAI